MKNFFTKSLNRVISFSDVSLSVRKYEFLSRQQMKFTSNQEYFWTVIARKTAEEKN